MNASLLDGKQVALIKQQLLKAEIDELQGYPAPHLAVILVGDDPASALYIRTKQKRCDAVGIQSTLIQLDKTISQDQLINRIHACNNDPNIHGILIQLPLPKTINSTAIIRAIAPEKDVDGFHPYNLGSLAQKSPTLRPCTPYGIIQLLEDYAIPIAGKHAVLVGVSPIVGRPMALELLLAKATVTLCHKSTVDLTKHTKQADILVTAIGEPQFIKKKHIKPGAVVVDVGITRLEDGRIVGDVDFDQVQEVASWITPVPGGVGPMTVTTLLQNTMQAYKNITQT